MKHGYYPTVIYKVFVKNLDLQYQSWGKGKWAVPLLPLIAHGYSTRVTVFIRSHSSKPFCAYAELVGDWEGSWSILYWVCDSFNWLLRPAPPHTFHGVFLHIFCLIPRLHMLNMADHEWSVLNITGITEWEKAQEVVHCREKKKEEKHKSNLKVYLEGQYSLPLQLGASILRSVCGTSDHSATGFSRLTQRHQISTSVLWVCSGVCGGVATCLKNVGKFLTQVPSKGS